MATIQLELKPWVAPKFAIVAEPMRPREEGLQQCRSIQVSDLSPETLREMANNWLSDLYDNAGQAYDWRFE